MTRSKIVVIGAGFSGLSAASYLAASGYEVHVYEKNHTPGGRARQFRTEEGFVFDMGPSWYWMPDVFEKFYNDFGHTASDYYQLDLLDPAFDIVYGDDDILHVPKDFEELCEVFESIEAGSGAKLRKFMNEAEFKYQAGMQDLVYKPGLSLSEFADINLARKAVRLQIFKPLSRHIANHFRHPKLRKLLEFPALFLGAMPENTPALYSLMNYAGHKLGTWYPQGGFGVVVDAFVKIAEENGVTIHYNSPVERINTRNGEVISISTGDTEVFCDGVIASADYAHVEEQLLEPDKRNYGPEYWKKKTFAPSSLIYYLGLDTKLDGLNHHTLFFDEDLRQHAVDIYKKPKWPEHPLFYVSCPSKTDTGVAWEGYENLFLLMPIAPGLEDDPGIREKYFNRMIRKLEKHTGSEIESHIIYKRSYSVSDFVADYNSYKGNAYGLANTLRQTAILKPKIRNNKIRNLFYTGQLTVPGPGVPPAIISGKVASDQLIKTLVTSHEITV